MHQMHEAHDAADSVQEACFALDQVRHALDRGASNA